MSPDTPGGNTPAPPATSAGRSKDNLPQGQLELATLAVAAATEWQASPLGDLLWKTKAQFLTQATAYRASLDTADEADDTIGPNAKRYRELDKLINKKLKFVKGYLAEESEEDDGKSLYEAFGIVREGSNWMLPIAQTDRSRKLQKLLLALKAHGHDKKKFGVAFWQPIADEYAALVADSGKTRGAASDAVGTKNAQEEPLREVLRALIHAIKANYPDEKVCKGVLRKFGFQKEVY
ncbi:hypothetical protein Q5H93_01880 [Hymenobacter sp. ASUV-10]|uniref:Uncharacterized protein n=1 Tax=Hymenobacter aranciens TaxID=3063996 RepID=A0ABT9BA87_9BACT|nr:hypothetical protein [Hymenobacter sp. ASUV-10]MDO7873463.1 hypothetical protein [Hymenobacter sp. ASUV-10]